MATLSKFEQAQLKGLLKDDRWSVFEKYVAGHLQSLQEGRVTGQNAFETLRALHTKEGKIEGIEILMQLLENAAFND